MKTAFFSGHRGELSMSDVLINIVAPIPKSLETHCFYLVSQFLKTPGVKSIEVHAVFDGVYCKFFYEDGHTYDFTLRQAATNPPVEATWVS